MNKKLKKRLIIGSIVVVIISILGYLLRGVFALIFFFASMESSSKEELIENYQENHSEIFNLKEKFDKIIPNGFKVYIEFKNDNLIDFWVFEKTNSANREWKCLFQEWGINPFDYEMKPLTKFDSTYSKFKTNNLEEIKRKINWTDSTFVNVRNLLEKANCISIENGTPSDIGFVRSGMGEYFYHIFDNPIPENEIEKWNDSCTYIYFKPKVVLGYLGGAIGAQSFPDPR